MKEAVDQSKFRNAVRNDEGEWQTKNTGPSRSRVVRKPPTNTNVQELPSVPSRYVPMATSKKIAIAAIVLLLLGVAGGGAAAAVILTRANASTDSTASTSKNKSNLDSIDYSN